MGFLVTASVATDNLQVAAVVPEYENATVPENVADPNVQFEKFLETVFDEHVEKPVPKQLAAKAVETDSDNNLIFDGLLVGENNAIEDSADLISFIIAKLPEPPADSSTDDIESPTCCASSVLASKTVTLSAAPPLQDVMKTLVTEKNNKMASFCIIRPTSLKIVLKK